MLSGKRIILGVTGGIAAYKAAFLLRVFQKEGAEVRVTMTPSATRFVGTETFASLSKSKVVMNISPVSGRESEPDAWTRHISWGEWGDLFVVAPCTANTLAKIASGMADNMLTSTVLAARCPILLCPTMDGEMYGAPATQQNLQKIRDFGYHLLEPEEGYLASGLEGKGRLPETEVILEKCASLLSESKKKVKGLLTGKKVLVTAGPTREHVDPVRFISNASSGKMGFAMAEAAINMGADVTLIHGPVSIDPPAGAETIQIESASELFEEVKVHSKTDIIIMAAAVSDFTPKDYQPHKVKKDTASSEIELKKTTDILAWLGEHRKNGQILIGFAMETEDLIENAAAKRKKKNIDWIIANSLNDAESGFEVNTNKVHLLGNGKQLMFKGTKKEVARKLLQAIFAGDQ